jgi:hypothetical protein
VRYVVLVVLVLVLDGECVETYFEGFVAFASIGLLVVWKLACCVGWDLPAAEDEGLRIVADEVDAFAGIDGPAAEPAMVYSVRSSVTATLL